MNLRLIQEKLKSFDVEELSRLSTIFAVDPPEGLCIPEHFENWLPVCITFTPAEKEEVEYYWRSIFGNVSRPEAEEQCEDPERLQELEYKHKMQ